MADKIALSWSGGKDSMLAFERLTYNGGYKISALFTVYNKSNGLLNLHNVPIDLIRKQAESLGVFLFEIAISDGASNTEYETAHLDFFQQLKSKGIKQVAFGDIFLEPIRNYRNKLSERAQMPFYYPLWGEDTDALSKEFIDRGYKAVVTSVQTPLISPNFLGNIYNEDFIASLPTGADTGGENGEFHTFVFDGPNFSFTVKYKLSAISYKDFRPEVDFEMAFIGIVES